MKLEQLTVTINGRKIIHPINVTINKGEIFVLMGPSGSGKTTLLRAIAGLTPVTSGSIHWPEKKGTIGLAFQEPRLFPHMNVIDNLAFGLRARGMSKRERYKKVESFLESLQLQGLEHRFPHELSGGQKQRVSLGRAIILNPDILLLDEPFSSLDTPLRIELTEWLDRLQKEQGFSILWVTHYLDEAFSVADQIGVMMDGEIKQNGNPIDVYHNPVSEEVASFFSLPNRFSKKIWQQLFPNHSFSEKNEMGWISANQLELVKDKHQPKEKESVATFEGIVQRIKHKKNGKILIVNSDNGNWDLFLDSWTDVPQPKTTVKVRVPFNKIIWYSK